MQQQQVVEIDMVNDAGTRNRIQSLYAGMCCGIPEDATTPEVATACYLILCEIAAQQGFDPEVVAELKDNLAGSLEQAEAQWRQQEGLSQ